MIQTLAPGSDVGQHYDRGVQVRLAPLSRLVGRLLAMLMMLVMFVVCTRCSKRTVKAGAGYQADVSR